MELRKTLIYVIVDDGESAWIGPMRWLCVVIVDGGERVKCLMGLDGQIIE